MSISGFRMSAHWQRGTQTRLGTERNTAACRAAAAIRVGLYLWCCVPAMRCGSRSCAAYAKAQTMVVHLEAGSQAVPPGRHAVILLDQEGWHTTLKLPHFPNVSLLSLPAGSPELNLAEQVWQQLRDRSLANCHYDSYRHIVEACC